MSVRSIARETLVGYKEGHYTPRNMVLVAAGRLEGDGLVRLEATATGTRLHYDYAAQVGGKVAMVGSRMLEGAARVIVGQLFEALGRQAAAAARGEGADAAAPSAAPGGLLARLAALWRRFTGAGR